MTSADTAISIEEYKKEKRVEIEEKIEIIGENDAFLKTIERAKKVANTNSNILIVGESGTGKELIAQIIHTNSERKNKPFIPVNCAAIPGELIESELFGHEKGSFTNAYKSRKGFLSQANKGTIFLDEIGEMSLSAQKKLLRVLEERRFYKIGGEQLIEVDVRIIAATNKNIAEEVRVNNFRRDLFYRINVVPILIPPLRHRKDDISKLVKYFIKKFNISLNKNIERIDPSALEKLTLGKWLGNVRELKNLIECAVAISDENTKTINEDMLFKHKLDYHNQDEDTLTTLNQILARAKKKALIQATILCKTATEAAEVLDIQRTYLPRLVKELFGCTFSELKKKYEY
ncbi:MAG: sigma 54-interacting transcriptional regulator [Candidatus Falkowbacteria bacterium]